MGTISERIRKDGKPTYRAQITIQRDGQKPIRESKTFERKKPAQNWIQSRESELRDLPDLSVARNSKVTLADAIDKYIAKSRKEIGKTKAQVLETIKGFEIADMHCDKIKSQHLVAFIEHLNKHVKPQTAANYLSHLGAVFAIAEAAWGIPLDVNEMQKARKVTTNLGLTAKSVERERRPTLDELGNILSHFEERSNRNKKYVPMTKVILFAIFSTRRQGEICNLLWSDLSTDMTSILVRDMKHPGQKIGNNVRCELTPRAKKIIEMMPKTAERIFPFNPDTISASFTRACLFLQINDLRFHDLRHEGISHYFEMGRTIPQLASVSGHRSWQSMQRYTQLHQSGDKYENWHWLK